MSETDNIVEAAWRRTLVDQLNNHMLMDSPKGKAAFACGVAFVLKRLEDKCDTAEWRRIFFDAVAFSEAYMDESRTLRSRQRE